MTPSTPRTERSRIRRFAPLLALGVLLAICVTSAAVGLPTPPQGPRYVGAGNDTPRSGGTFVFAGGSNVRTLDPHIAYDELSYTAIRLLFDGLLDYDYEGELVPSLARELPTISEDGRVFRFRLREGVRFHNGRELVAEDVRWSLEKLLHPDTASPGYPFFKSVDGAEAFHHGAADGVAGIEVKDRYTIEFRLTEPDRTFLNAIAMPFAYPVPRENYERWAAEGSTAVGRHPVGTGPFRLVDWERGVQLIFERNEDYWVEDKPNPDRMVYLENLQGEVPVARFRNGDLDVLSGAPAIHYLFFKDAEAWQPYMEEWPGVSVYGLAMNCEMEPFDDPHVRRAVAFALDRDAIRRTQQGRSMPAGQPLPPPSPGHDPELPTAQRFDLERARAEMRLAGYEDGIEEPVQVWIGEGEGALKLAQLWQQDLARIGIEVELKQVSFATYLQQTGRRGTVQAFTTGWHMDFPDPSNVLDVLFNSRAIRDVNAENRAFYENPELDAILDEARAEIDADERLALYRKANAIVARDAPWAFLFYPLEFVAWQPYVKNFRPHPIWSNEYRDVWLDLPRRRVDDDVYTEFED